MHPLDNVPNLDGRQQRRMLARAQRMAARQPRVAATRAKRGTVGPVHKATIRQRLEREIAELVTRAGLHSYLGADTRALSNDYGRVLWMCCYAAGAQGMADAPEIRVLIGSANALGDIVALPASLEQHRPALISGLAAAQRLLPRLDTWALGVALQELEEMLQRPEGLDIEMLERAVGEWRVATGGEGQT